MGFKGDFMKDPKDRVLIHRVPEYAEDGTVARARWFRTVKEAKAFAKEQARRLGHGGYTIDHLPFEALVDALKDAPFPSWWRTR